MSHREEGHRFGDFPCFVFFYKPGAAMLDVVQQQSKEKYFSTFKVVQKPGMPIGPGRSGMPHPESEIITSRINIKNTSCFIEFSSV
jgi:hypothetical protein